MDPDRFSGFLLLHAEQDVSGLRGQAAASGKAILTDRETPNITLDPAWAALGTR